MLKLYVKAQSLMQSLKDESGQDFIEYAMLGALVAVVVAAALPALATKITGVFTAIEAAL
jgi:pilus assembly protein Flp/PilA